MKSRDTNALVAIAALAGAAVGAVAAILLAPKSGREIRSQLSYKRIFGNQTEDELYTDRPVEELWERTRDHAEKLQGPSGKRKDPSRIHVPSAGTTAWRDQENTPTPPWKEDNHTEGKF